jgi:hypothetical protein
MDGGLVDEYLDQLLAELRVPPARLGRILAETEDHLRTAIEHEMAAGASPDLAARRAIARFGSPRVVAHRYALEEGRLPLSALVLPLMLSLGLLAGVGLLAIGASGALAAGLGAAFGKTFIAGDPPGITYTPARCADYREYHPEAGDCAAAATAHHFDEVVEYRLAAGVLGALTLAGWAVLRRRLHRFAVRGILPEGFTAIAGAALFGVAAVGLLVSSLGPMAFGDTSGAGGLLTGGIVALAVFAVYAGALTRTLVLRTPRG